ncbi:hypothetical protein HK405_013562, partial [Cladochytrium tenue]
MGGCGDVATKTAARQLPDVALSRIAFFGITRNSIPTAVADGGDGHAALQTVRLLETEALAELRRVSLSWCRAFSPHLFHLAHFFQVLHDRSYASRCLALLRVLLPDPPPEVGSGSPPSERLPRVAELVRVVHILGWPEHGFLSLLRRLALPNLHSIYLETFNVRGFVGALPRSPSIKLLSIDGPGMGCCGGDQYPLDAVVGYLGELPGLVSLHLAFSVNRLQKGPRSGAVAAGLTCLTDLRLFGAGLLSALVSWEVVNPATVVSFSGTKMDEGEYAINACDSHLPDQFESLIARAPPALAHFCLVYAANKADLAQDAESAWLVASRFRGKAAGGSEKRLSLFSYDWPSDYGFKRDKNKHYVVLPPDTPSGKWEVVRLGQSRTEDERLSLDTHSADLWADDDS